jgi:hypothetical protein
MAYRTISLQSPWRLSSTRAMFGEKTQGRRQGQVKKFDLHMMSDLDTLTRHHPNVAREERAPWTIGGDCSGSFPLSELDPFWVFQACCFPGEGPSADTVLLLFLEGPTSESLCSC